MKLRSLKNRAQFDRVFREGTFAVKDALVCYCRRNNGAGTRIGISLSRRVGNAVQRNRLRRWIREIVREESVVLTPGWDVVFLVRAPGEMNFASLRKRVLYLLKNRRLLEDTG